MQGIMMEHISKDFSGKAALKNVDLFIRKGTVHAIIGENGAGKSTLMNILSGALEPSGGIVTMDGQPLVLRGPQDAAGYGIGMVYQHFMLIPVLKVWQNIIMGIEPKKHLFTIDKAAALKKIKAACEDYGIEINPEQLVGNLTVGEQQRIEILKVMMRNAEYIILDEPTAVLTPQETLQLCDNIRALKAKGKTIIFISHKLEEVLDIADEITVLRLGEKIGTIDAKDATPDKLVQMMLGRELHLDGYPLQTKIGEAVLEIHELCTERTGFSAGLQKINLNVHAHEVLGIAGVDGNGQTELVDAILGIKHVESGSILKDGAAITNRSVPYIRSSGISLIPADRQRQGLVMQLPIMMNTALGCENHPKISKGGFLRRKKLEQTIPPLLQAYDVRMPSVEAKASELSGGNQQKIILAREFGLREGNLALAVNPTRGLDIGAIEFVYEQIEEQKKAGKAVLLISTELSEIMRLSDRIAVFYKGECMGILPREKADLSLIGKMMMGYRAREDEA